MARSRRYENERFDKLHKNEHKKSRQNASKTLRTLAEYVDLEDDWSGEWYDEFDNELLEVDEPIRKPR